MTDVLAPPSEPPIVAGAIDVHDLPEGVALTVDVEDTSGQPRRVRLVLPRAEAARLAAALMGAAGDAFHRTFTPERARIEP